MGFFACSCLATPLTSSEFLWACDEAGFVGVGTALAVLEGSASTAAVGLVDDESVSVSVSVSLTFSGCTTSFDASCPVLGLAAGSVVVADLGVGVDVDVDVDDERDVVFVGGSVG